ncbi:entry exclusion lipoprotein TrbK [Marinomonas ostreistagni]|uniref:Entry exclusion lipoprotein TrbK n=1 Tax=Marinomonas ostreistagni TaxID=359209 RepID=A0ABS0Z673_9GAMM|nr:entry exclusion lipoprotein TrbK [Marinomonas ostreistagni]MBJ7549163.1 entry exclusion lipoprotein TrbK [Marinomonas ostreistagni]
MKKYVYMAGVIAVALVVIISPNSDGVFEANVENCKSENLRQIGDEHVMWQLSSECQKEGLYKLNS